MSSRSSGAEGDSDRVSAYNVATKQIPAALWANSPAFAAHGLSAALDKSAIGARVSSALWGIKPSTLGLGLTTVAAVFAPRRRVRRGAISLLIGFLHAKLHDPAAAVPELVTAVAQKAGVAPPGA